MDDDPENRLPTLDELQRARDAFIGPPMPPQKPKFERRSVEPIRLTREQIEWLRGLNDD